MLVRMAREQELRILTNDQNLRRVAEINGLPVLNLNDLGTALRSSAIPGDRLNIEVIKRGEGSDQGVGYLDDGTMIVVEGGASLIGETVTVIVNNALQTSAGWMIFSRADTPEQRARGERSTAPEQQKSDDSLRAAATRQPRSTGPGPRSGDKRPPKGGRGRSR